MKTLNPRIRLSKANIIAEITRWVEQNGPTPENYFELDELIKLLAIERKRGAISEEDLKEINNAFGEDFQNGTMQGHCYKKPMGYPGDFRIIDMIYTFQKSSNPRFANWDDFFHQHAAPKAVRNRKEYFKRKLIGQFIDTRGTTIQLLNVASGSSRDLMELYKLIPDGMIKSVCIDFDCRAITYAKELNKEYSNHIEFIAQNIFKFNTDDKYDVIWSAGLFDYFDDKSFKYILKKFASWLKPNGKIIVGNFSMNNPSRDYMELFGDWNLNHRTHEQLISLANETGFALPNVSIEEEEEGVNLFLNISL